MTYAIVSDLIFIGPELFVCLSAILLLMIGAFRGNDVTPLIAFASAIVLVAALYMLTSLPAKPVMVFHNMLRLDGLTMYARLLIVLGAFLTLILSFDWLKQAEIKRFEYPVLMLLSVTGLMLLVSANDLLSFYMALELSSLAMYVMATFERDNGRSTEAGLKYFVLGSLASGMMLFGSSLIYGFSGTTNFSALAELLAGQQGVSAGLVVGLVFVMVGFCFKMSAVPFHMWTPDVYEGAPTPVVAFFAVAPKIAVFILFIRLLMGPFEGLFAHWQQIVIVISMLSMLVGAFGALRQTNIKRLLAYSSIGHVGYALIGVATGQVEGVQAALIYLSLYLFMSVGAFGFIIFLKRQGQPVEAISELGGMSRHSPVKAMFMSAMMFSMAGIPPLAGFFGKFYIFLSAIEQQLYALVIVGLLSSVVAAFYYIKIVKIMYFDESRETFDSALDLSAKCVLSLCGLVVLLFFLSPTPLISVTAVAAEALNM